MKEMHILSLYVLDYFSTYFFVYFGFGKTVLKNLLLGFIIKMEKSIESHLVLRKTILSLGGGNFVKTSEKEVFTAWYL